MSFASEAAVPKTVMSDATCLKAHRTASGLRSKKGPEDQRAGAISRTKGGMNTKLHADAVGRPIRLFMAAGEAQ